MFAPRIPDNETHRLAALCALNVLDTPPEPRFDRLTGIASTLFEVPIALVSLVDADRQWFKSRHGLAAEQTPRDVSFCGHAILQHDLFIVPDARADPRFADNPLVTGPPHVVFYAGAPLSAVDGSLVGTLCLIDHTPRELSLAQQATLRSLAEITQEELSFKQMEDNGWLYRAEQQRLQTVLDTVIDGIICIDERGTILLANPAAERLFGHSMAAMLGHNVKMLMPPVFEREHDQYLANYQATRVPKIIGVGREVQGQRKDGTVFPMELAVSEMFFNGRSQFVGVVRDISERKRMERVKQEFIATVSHELRTPLTSIRGALALVMKKSGDLLPEKSRQMLETAVRNSERLTALVNDILDLEKIEGGQLQFEFRLLDLCAAVQQAAVANEAYAERHGVCIDCTVPPVPLLVRADEQRLFQVLANLISNAAKFSPQGARVAVTVVDRGDGSARISVRDHGRGIPEEFKERIFGRFTQADSSDSRDKGGAGLGLSIAKAIAERHGGTMSFDSRFGEGSTFHVDLPLQTAGGVQKAASFSSLAGPSTNDVLICEDNRDVADIICGVLEEDQIGCDIAATATEARQRLQQQVYKLMLLDLRLPDADGLSLLMELRADPRLEGLLFIVISGAAQEGRARWSGDALAVADWIQKPFDEAHLRRSVERALAAGRRARVLHVEDDPDLLTIVKGVLDGICDYESATSALQARAMLGAGTYDLVLLDLGLPDSPGEDLLSNIPAGTAIVVLSGRDALPKSMGRIAARLEKSDTSNERLLATVKGILNKATGKAYS